MNGGTRTNRLLLGGMLALVTLLTAALLYGGSYLWFGAAWRPGPGPGPHPIRLRVFPDARLAEFYGPAVWFESQMRGYPINTGDEETLRSSSP